METVYYHVSRSDLGESIVLTPKLPESCDVEDEGDIPRICVSPSIKKCLNGILAEQKFSVYQFLEAFRTDLVAFEDLDEWIEKKALITSPVVYKSIRKAYLPPDANDFRKNEEHWYVSETEFERCGYIGLTDMLNFQIVQLKDSPESMPGEALKDWGLKKKIVKNK